MFPQRAMYVIVAFYLLALPSAAAAQSALSGAIAGVVRDTTGAVLPGVTVEASSPALIEQARTAVTDGQGLYRIVELRPGTYTVAFSLPGFAGVRREGIELSTGFTATVNADLRVGTVEETITVTGAASTVDVQNVMTQTVLSQNLLDSLPTSKTIRGYAPLIPGASVGAAAQDVGGSQGEPVGGIAIHGNRAGDMIYTVNGMRPGNLMGSGGGQRTYSVNAGAAQEITFQTGGISAESETGGIQMNVVPKEGGNSFSGYFFTSFANSAMQSENITDELIARGMQPQFKLRKIYDVNTTFGGPIKRDRLWFFGAQRTWGTEVPRPTPGDYRNQTQGTRFYTPDLSQPFFQRSPRRSNSIRLTWQVTERQKVNFGYDLQRNCNCPQLQGGNPGAPEALGYHRYKENLTDASWFYPATSRLLFEAGWAWYNNTTNYDPTEGVLFQESHIAITEQSTGWRHNSRATATNTDGGYGIITHDNLNQRISASYVTGSHSFKTGIFLQQGIRHHLSHMIGDRAYTLDKGVPRQVTIFASPAINDNRISNIGIYTQDQWTLRRLTLNLGVRFDYLNGWDPEQTVGAGEFVPARTYPETRNLPNFKDLSPRLGAAYNLFGDGRTAIKASLGRYVQLEGARLSQTYHPANQLVTNANRTWDDTNNNFRPDCNLTAPQTNGECGPLSNVRFGQSVISTRPADDILTGFGNRTYSWQGSASVQHELWRGLSLNVGYFRTWYGNFTATDNLAVTPADYDDYCIAMPTHPRLPGGGGGQMCGLYDLRPAQFGLVDNLVTQSSHYGKETEVYNGFDVTMSARFGAEGVLTGGLSTGRTVTDSCDSLVDSPDKRFCRVINPFKGQTQLKVSGAYPLPWDFQVSATYQNLPGLPIQASHVVSNALIAPSLGRNVGACRGNPSCNANVTIDQLIAPNTLFEGRIQQVDLRFSRRFRFGRASVDGTFDAFNALNASPILAMTTRFGQAWLSPTQILAGRTLKVGGRVTF
jgi:hypothetical protein